MTPLFIAGSCLTVFGLAILLVAEWRRSKTVIWVAKPLASAGFLIASLGCDPFATTYGYAIFCALGLSFLGDVLLIPASKVAFLGGLTAFLLGHAAFGTAFVLRGFVPEVTGIAFAVLIVPGQLTWRWLMPHLGPGMRKPVLSYLLVISAMLSLAAGSAWLHPSWLLPAGALAFYLSDLAVARDRFVVKGFSNRAWGLPLYYAAQLVLAASAG